MGEELLGRIRLLLLYEKICMIILMCLWLLMWQ
jgi:hypothetical protein